MAMSLVSSAIGNPSELNDLMIHPPKPLVSAENFPVTAAYCVNRKENLDYMVGASRGVHIIADTLRFHEQPDW
jgi:hypothetical protein